MAACEPEIKKGKKRALEPSLGDVESVPLADDLGEGLASPLPVVQAVVDAPASSPVHEPEYQAEADPAGDDVEEEPKA